MLLVYTQEKARARMSNADSERLIAGHAAVQSEATKRGVFRGAEPLMPTSTATTVRTANGKVMIIDGPFAETKEQLGGYYILECETLEEAVEWAKRIPTECGGAAGSIEIRAIRPTPVLDSLREQ
jgi:hypothetical protein